MCSIEFIASTVMLAAVWAATVYLIRDLRMRIEKLEKDKHGKD